MYAIIATGGKQYRVSQGDVIFVEKIDQDVDSTIDFDVLMLAGDDGVKVGNPVVSGRKRPIWRRYPVGKDQRQRQAEISRLYRQGSGRKRCGQQHIVFR